MNIKQAKQEIIDTVQAYLLKNEYDEYVIPRVHQRPVLLLGAPGIGKTQIMEQAARECGVALVAYTITHHTRQSAIGLPFISKKEYGGREYSATEYTMSEIVASIYDQMCIRDRVSSASPINIKLLFPLTRRMTTELSLLFWEIPSGAMTVKLPVPNS